VVSINCVKQQKRVMIDRYGHSNNLKGFAQVLTTLLPLALLWWAALMGTHAFVWLTVAVLPLITLFTLRVFALMHECGHGSLFRSRRLNRTAGFLFGVISGMPQYVWSQHHNYHHAHNGNWEKYRGPYATRSVDEFAAMSIGQQRMYRSKCSAIAAPLAGFIYLTFMPRFTWIKGSLSFLAHVARSKVTQPATLLKDHVASFKTPYWKSAKEYRHMFWNNVVLLGIWTLMCLGFGATAFFTIYLITLSLAGGAGIVLFTVQHNFRHAHATDSKRWDYDVGAINGTSFLILPRWLNWFTANIGYHHIHHISAKIPNYSLVSCHNEHEHLFQDVTRVELSQVYDTLKYILWDTRAERIISIAEYRQQVKARAWQ